MWGVWKEGGMERREGGNINGKTRKEGSKGGWKERNKGGRKNGQTDRHKILQEGIR